MRLSVASIVAAVGLMPLAASAGIVETFSYANGPLTVVSGGAWNPWTAGAGDSTVSGGVASVNGNTDVIREFPNELQAVGAWVAFSFDVKVVTPNTAGTDYYFAFSPATAPYTTGQNYGDSMIFIIDQNTGPAGASNVYAWPNGGATTLVGTIAAGAFHTLSGFMNRSTAGAVSYSLSIDGGASFNNSFTITDPRGINAFEYYQGSGTGVNDNCFIDNLRMTAVPAPASLGLLALGGLVAGRRRRA